MTETHDLVLIVVMFAAGWVTCWSRRRYDGFPVTAWQLRRAHAQNRADLRRSLTR